MAAPVSQPSRLVLLCGGSPHAHDFDDIGAALVEVLSGLGPPVELVSHPDGLPSVLASTEAVPESATSLGDGRPVLVVHGLWWRMLAEVYEPWRADHAYASTEVVRSALAGFVHGGGGLVAMHTTPVCFDDWPGWADVVGAGWVWGTSFHPPPAATRFEVAPSVVTDGLGASFELVDEVYGDLAMAPTGEVVVRARRNADDELQPIVWTHRFGRGRVVGDLLGHDGASILDPSHRRIIENAIRWVAASGEGSERR